MAQPPSAEAPPPPPPQETPDPHTPAEPAYARQPVQDAERLGDILRSTREHRGENLYVISDFLRIRPAFLAALENSHYDELPADAYVIGFLRTYAAYLGLDSKAAIDHYRREMAGRRHKPQLNMPQPISEGRAPTVSILIGAALAALLLYVLWYSLSSSNRTAIDTPPPMAQTAQSEPSVAAPASQGIELNAHVPAESSFGLSPSVSVPAATLPITPTPTTSESAATKPGSEPTIDSTVTSPPTPSKPEDFPKETPEKPASDNAAKPETAPVVSADESTSKVYGSAANGKITLRAVEESWVLVADGKGNTVFDKILQPGDLYNVPGIKGLKLTTGNGGGIVLSLDGVDLPRLGTEARIIRNVPLDAEKLRARKPSSNE